MTFCLCWTQKETKNVIFFTCCETPCLVTSSWRRLWTTAACPGGVACQLGVYISYLIMTVFVPSPLSWSHLRVDLVNVSTTWHCPRNVTLWTKTTILQRSWPWEKSRVSVKLPSKQAPCPDLFDRCVNILADHLDSPAQRWKTWRPSTTTPVNKWYRQFDLLFSATVRESPRCYMLLWYVTDNTVQQ